MIELSSGGDSARLRALREQRIEGRRKGRVNTPWDSLGYASSDSGLDWRFEPVTADGESSNISSPSSSTPMDTASATPGR